MNASALESIGKSGSRVNELQEKFDVVTFLQELEQVAFPMFFRLLADFRIAKAGQIDKIQRDLRIAKAPTRFEIVNQLRFARRARTLRELLREQAIEQRALAHIAPAHERDFAMQRRGRLVNGLCRCEKARFQKSHHGVALFCSISKIMRAGRLPSPSLLPAMFAKPFLRLTIIVSPSTLFVLPTSETLALPCSS